MIIGVRCSYKLANPTCIYSWMHTHRFLVACIWKTIMNNIYCNLHILYKQNVYLALWTNILILSTSNKITRIQFNITRSVHKLPFHGLKFFTQLWCNLWKHIYTCLSQLWFSNFDEYRFMFEINNTWAIEWIVCCK